MARTVTRSVLRSRARQLANVENDPSVLDADINEWLNLHLTDVYDLLVAAGPPDYYAASTTVTTVSGTIEYALPSDFLSIVNVYANESSDIRRSIDPIGDRERHAFKAPNGAWSVTVEYIPVCPTLSSDGSTFDGINGWDELVAAKTAIMLLAKREGDPTIPVNIVTATMARIKSAASQRQRGGPRLINDVEQEYMWPRSVRIDGFRLRAGNIELYESLWGEL